MIYYAITYINVTRYVKQGDYSNVYDKIMFITDNHEEAANAASWCELAEIGETYQSETFTIEIIED